MCNLLAVLYLVVFVASGVLVANAVNVSQNALRRLFFGLVFGLAMLLWLPALISFAFSFTLLSQLLALAVAIAVGTVCFFVRRPKELFRIPSSELIPLAAVALPLLLVSLTLLSTHTIVNRGGALWVGQSTYGDLAMHLGFMTSIAAQETFPPMYSICPGTPVGYPFLSDSVSATFLKLGASLRFAAMLPAALAFLIVIVGVHLFFSEWLKSKRAAALGTYLFFIGGGFGFAYFFDLAKFEPGKLAQLFTAFYETPTNFPDKGLRWVNAIADMLIPQRATLFGWALLFPCLYLLYRAAFCGERKSFFVLGALAGLMPLVHTHSFLALGMISAFYLLRCVLKSGETHELTGFLFYALIALALAAPQLLLFTFKQSGGFLTVNWNWDNVSDSYLWFYIKNLGLLFILTPVAFCSLDSEDRWVFGGSMVIWAVAEVVQFQPNPYDNNKLLFVFFAFICALVAKYLVRVYDRLLGADGVRPPGTKLLAAFACVALFLSGALTLGREYLSQYQLLSREEVAMADYVEANTAPDATFLTYNNHNNAVAVLTGRNIVCGSGTFLFFHGIDYTDREQALPLMYEEPSQYFDALAKKYGVDYVLVGPYERYQYDIDDAYFTECFEVFYDAGGLTIYRVNPDA